jgi:phosphatidylserine/phosphatidylglycerophosphate/cardiolipin synthase-like enzyme
MPIRSLLNNNQKKYRYPWRSGGHYQLLVDGPQFFPVMLDAIEAAENFICLETYLMESGKITERFITALVAARQRGVKIYMLLDDYGSNDLHPVDRQCLWEAGIQLAFYNPASIRKLYQSLIRNHRKLLLVDGKLAFVGGAGLTDEFMQPAHPIMNWHEIMLKVEGPAIQDWFDLFARTWQETTQAPCPLSASQADSLTEDQLGRVSIAEGFGRQEINQSLIKRCRSAERRIWISTPYFIISRKLRHILRRAARHGIDVRVLVPGPISDHPWVSHASRGYYMRLLRQGVRIFEYQPRFLHAKVQLCDNWVSIGSSNLDRWNQHWNLDANQEVDDPHFAARVEALLTKDFAQSIEIHFQDWVIRPRWQRLREWFWGRFVRLLELLSRRHHKKRESSK